MSQKARTSDKKLLYAGTELVRARGQVLRQIDPRVDPLTWCAVYQDETTLWECNPEGYILYTYHDIQREALQYFRVYSTEAVLNFWATKKRDPSNPEIKPPSPIIVIELNAGKRLIWRKRRLLELSGKAGVPIFLAGWQQTFNVVNEAGEVEEKSVKAINYLYPTGVIILADRKDNVELKEWETVVRSDGKRQEGVIIDGGKKI